jgi:hypothetical protein
MMQRLQTIWRRWTATRYTRWLEAEVARLRLENRALLNSILGIAGIPPITVDEISEAGEDKQSQKKTPSTGSGLDHAGVARLKGMRRVDGRHGLGSPVGAPLRRRSWHQVNRALEIDAVRKKAEELNTAPQLGIATNSRIADTPSIGASVG